MFIKLESNYVIVLFHADDDDDDGQAHRGKEMQQTCGCSGCSTVAPWNSVRGHMEQCFNAVRMCNTSMRS